MALWAGVCPPCPEVRCSERCLQENIKNISSANFGSVFFSLDVDLMLLLSVKVCIYIYIFLTRLFKSSLHPLGQPAQVTVAVQGIGAKSTTEREERSLLERGSAASFTATRETRGRALTGGTRKWGGWRLPLEQWRGRYRAASWKMRHVAGVKILPGNSLLQNTWLIMRLISTNPGDKTKNKNMK